MMLIAILTMIGLTGGSIALAVCLIRGNLRLKRELAAANLNLHRLAEAVKADHAAVEAAEALDTMLKEKKDAQSMEKTRRSLSDRIGKLLD